MELKMCNWQKDFWRCIIQSWQSCVVFNTQCRYFSMIFQIYPLKIKWFLPTRWYIIFSILVYTTSLIPYLNRNLNSFTIETLVFLSVTRLEWLNILWIFTETCRWWKFSKKIYRLQSSSVFLRKCACESEV